MGDSWSVGAWRMTSHHHCYHDGVSHYLREKGHSVTVIGRGGSDNITQLEKMQTHTEHHQLNQDWDHIIWLWTDCLRECNWYHAHQPGIHNIYDIHSNQEQWVQAQITKRNPDLWSKIIMIGGQAPLMTEWPCVHLKSWCEAMGHIETGQDHPYVDPVKWRDFVNWCNGRPAMGNQSYDDTDDFSHVHQMMWQWIHVHQMMWQWIRSFSREHKQHHIDFLQRSQERHDLLVYGTTKPSYTNWNNRSRRKQFRKGMMGEDLHPNLKAHKWLTDWILTHHHKN